MRTLGTRLTLVLGALLTLMSVFCVIVTVQAMSRHMQAIDQALHRQLAGEVLRAHLPEIRASLATGQELPVFRQLMTINPNAEFYLLDAGGRVMSHIAPAGRDVMEHVALAPIMLLLAGAPLPVLGDDPRAPVRYKAFSAAAVDFDGIRAGYVYVVLGGDAYRSAAELFEASHIVRLALGSLILASIAAFAAGAIAFNLLSRRLARLADAMRAFDRAGFRDSPVLLAPRRLGDEVDELARVYSAMAGRIAAQFAELKRTDSSRRELLTHISHDLRTPLATLQAYLETLVMKADELSAETRNTYLGSALTFTHRIDRLTADLFELATLDLHEAPFRPEHIALAELLQDIGRRFALQASRKGIDLEVSAPAPGPFLVADIGLIERLIANLIDNAIKFTGPGGRVTIGLEETLLAVAIRVGDTGIGIAAEEIDHIFERFYRAPSRPQGADGTGLGLAIAKRIAELHGGGLTVESRPGVGSTFTVRLPSRGCAVGSPMQRLPPRAGINS